MFSDTATDRNEQDQASFQETLLFHPLLLTPDIFFLKKALALSSLTK